jgi:hypothetical protein
LTNLIGCILTDQLPIQKITAVYYITMDVVLLSQFKSATCSSLVPSHLTSFLRYYDWKKGRALRAGSYGNSMQQPLLSDSSSSSSGAIFVSSRGKRVAPALAVTLAMVRFICFFYNREPACIFAFFTIRF